MQEKVYKYRTHKSFYRHVYIRKYDLNSFRMHYRTIENHEFIMQIMVFYDSKTRSNHLCVDVTWDN